MKPGWTVTWSALFGLLGGLLAAGVILLVSRTPHGPPVALLPAPLPEPVRVHVAGAVARPGVYSLPYGSRVEEAIQAAGGLLPEAETQDLNLALPLQDGARLLVPLRRSTPTPLPVFSRSTGATVQVPAEPAPTPLPGLVNINTATLEELDTLPGIGPATAQKILDYRSAHGPFTSLEGLLDVAGIGPATFERLEPLITLY